MTSIHDFVGSDYLKAADLNGQERNVQLSGFTIETLKGDHGDEKKVIVKFLNQQKGMVINKTNAAVLLRMFASDQIEAWNAAVQATPTWVTLYTEATQMGDGLRIRPAMAPAAVQPAQQMDPSMMAQFAQFQAFLAAQKQ